MVCLTLSQTGWDLLRKPLVMEAFDRNVLWLLRKTPELEKDNLSQTKRLALTFSGSRTSLRLLMFQTYFMSCIGHPNGSRLGVLESYERQMGKPTLEQKNGLQQAAKEILLVTVFQTFRRTYTICPTP